MQTLLNFSATSEPTFLTEWHMTHYIKKKNLL
jgi:hypothetical protein